MDIKPCMYFVYFYLMTKPTQAAVSRITYEVGLAGGSKLYQRFLKEFKQAPRINLIAQQFYYTS